MEIILFGNTQSPAINFTLDPEEGMQIQSGDCYCLDYSGISGTLNWQEFARRVTSARHRSWSHGLLAAYLVARCDRQAPVEKAKWATERAFQQFFGSFKDDLLECTSTPTERAFLSKYFEWTKGWWEKPEWFESIPALVPQAWVSWLHYRPDDRQRAELLHRQPSRVDFICFVLGRKVVIEIDGWSHICDNYVTFRGNGSPAEEASMQKYTEHLKKDRWLRRQGWEVHRFSTLEVEHEEISQLLTEIRMPIPDPIPF